MQKEFAISKKHTEPNIHLTAPSTETHRCFKLTFAIYSPSIASSLDRILKIPSDATK